MKQLVCISIICLLSAKLIGSEPPPSPRDGKDAAQKAFIQQLAERKAAQDARINSLIAASTEARSNARGHTASLEEEVHLLTIVNGEMRFITAPIQ